MRYYEKPDILITTLHVYVKLHQTFEVGEIVFTTTIGENGKTQMSYSGGKSQIKSLPATSLEARITAIDTY